jgi:hypothetical protein
MFGRAGGITDGVQMKDTLEPAVGVGFYEHGELCIQGKGVTWEAAFAHARSREDKWMSRAAFAGATPSRMPKVPQSAEHDRNKRPDFEEPAEESPEEAFIRRLREQLKNWVPPGKRNLDSGRPDR